MSGSSHKSKISAIHAAVGEALDGWSHVEHALEDLFVVMTTADAWDAHLIMVSVVSFDARLKICNTLMGRYHRLDIFKRWGALYNKLDRKYRKRSELAHASVVQLNDKIRLVPFYSLGQSFRAYVGKDPDDVKHPKGLTPKEILERAKSFRALADSLGKFTTGLREERARRLASREQASGQARQPDQTDHSPTE